MTRACTITSTMRSLPHIQLSEEVVGLAEVTVPKEDALDLLQIRAREERVNGVTTSPTPKVSDVVRNKNHGFVTLLLRQVWQFDFRL